MQQNRYSTVQERVRLGGYNMCKHIWKKINDVSVCTKCGISICNGKFVQFDRKIVNKLRKLASK